MIKEKYPHSSKFNLKHILPENTRENIMKFNTSKNIVAKFQLIY